MPAPKLMYKGFSLQNPKSERLEIVNNFLIKEYLEENDGILNMMKFTPQYSDTDLNIPTENYTDDWIEISRRLREQYKWKCSSCHVDMSTKKEGLHVHHKNRNKNDNRSSNLQILCALCHRNIDDSHKNMYVKPDIEQFIQKARLSMNSRRAG